MGLGDNAGTAAAHALMIVILALMLYRLHRLATLPRGGLDGMWLLPAPVSMLIYALVIERIYYLLARILIANGGVNLWTLHPAPAILSLIVAFSALWIAPTYFALQGMTLRSAVARCGAEIIAGAVFWFVLWRVLI